MQKHVNLVDLVKSFPTNIFLQNLASIQKRTSPIKFNHLAEKSDESSISNLSTKPRTAAPLAWAEKEDWAENHRNSASGGKDARWSGGGGSGSSRDARARASSIPGLNIRNLGAGEVSSDTEV